jgi:hypothetical protein
MPACLQDGGHEGVAEVARQLAPAFRRAAAGYAFWQKLPRVAALAAEQAGHAWLAQHYKWGLDKVFLEEQHSHVVVVEDDMLFSPGGRALGWAWAWMVGACSLTSVYVCEQISADS